MATSKPAPMRRALICAVLTLLAMAWASGEARAATVTNETALPSIFKADLEAAVDPLGETTSCKVEYTTAVAFAEGDWSGAATSPCSPATIPAAGPAQRVTAELSGLASDTEYRYRFVVSTDSGVTFGGADEPFFNTLTVETFSVEAIGPDRSPDTAAGSHPYELVTRISLPYEEVSNSLRPVVFAKDVLAELPPGLVGDPTAVERCPIRLAEERRCSGDSQVGVLKIYAAGAVKVGPNKFTSQVFNVAPAIGKPARFGGLITASTNAFIDAGVRSGADYGITAGAFNIPPTAAPFAFEVRMWGVPADPRHDALRWCPDIGEGCSVTPGTVPKPFLRNPTSCAGPLQARTKVTSYNLPGIYFAREHLMPAITGCDKLEFKPTLQVRPTSATADSPTGLKVDLRVPQSEDPDELATPDLRDAVVKLPPGLTLNPSSASGLESCTPAQIGLTTPVGTTPIHTTAAPAECPDAAKIGTVEVDSPLLDHPLPGAIYVATPYENPFKSLLAIYIAVNDPESGVVIKLAGHVDIGPEGQLTTTFEENPQLPFESFKLDFFDGPRSALKTPAVCGTYTTTSTLTPWSAPQSGPPATPSESHQISSAPGGGNCPTAADQLPNNPSFQAGTESPLAGAFSPFVLKLARNDGSQQFSSLTVTPPPGLLGKLAGIPYCPDSSLAAAAGKSGAEEKAAASCPVASEVGVVNVGAGAGPSPFYTQGRAYLSGPYRGAPLSLAIITPAVAGPYDLGTVVVRSALEIDPATTQITVKSDPIPTELKGIPLDVRSIAVKMSRGDFTLNPTNCEAMNVGGTVTSPLGNTATLANPFQVGSCSKLGFKPKLSLRIKGATKRGSYQALTATLKARPGDSNIGRAAVTMPHSLFLAQEHIRTVCTRVQFAANACPRGSVYGSVSAISPLLDFPLAGPVYLRSSSNPLPDLVAVLRGPDRQPIEIELAARTDSVNASLRNTFDVVPDAPVSSFTLKLLGGKRSLLVTSRNMCRKPGRPIVKFAAQNGRAVTLRPRLRTSCKKSKAQKRGQKRDANGQRAQ
jgi:hypothetical protein